MFNKLAPVGLSTYSRLGHLRQTVEALQNNFLAKETELFIFSDGAKVGDEEKVCAVRAYLKTITGFKSVQIFERPENNRVKNNRGGIMEMFKEYDRIIFLEEDVVTAPGFLIFMNKALSHYEFDKRVFSINGWCPRFTKPPSLQEGEAFFIPRFSSWGFGIWKDRYEKIKNIEPQEFIVLKNNKIAMDRIHKEMGANLIPMMQADALGKINALDVRASFHQALTGELTLYPYPALVRNIGLDGSGEHCQKELVEINGRVGDELIDYAWPDAFLNKEVAKMFAEMFALERPMSRKIIEFMKLLGVYKYYRSIMK